MRSIFAATLGLALFLYTPPLTAQTRDDTRPIQLFEKFSVRVPPGWRAVNPTQTSVEIYLPFEDGKPRIGRTFRKEDDPEFIIPGRASTLVTIENRRSHAEAVRRLAEIGSERRAEIRTTIIDGWPAIEYSYGAPLRTPGQTRERNGAIPALFLTTAVAADTNVVRFDTTLAPGEDRALLGQAAAMARSLRNSGGSEAESARELEIITRSIKVPPAPQPPSFPEPGNVKPSPRPKDNAGTAVRARSGVGELEVAVSNDGQHVVVATQFANWAFSDNAGGAWTSAGPIPCTGSCSGDPSIAVGFSGTFYYGFIAGPTTSTRGDVVARSTDSGHTFPSSSVAVACPGASSCALADQEHIAADRVNAGATGDRVYNVWRNFPTAGAQASRLVCSSSGGTTWGTQIGLGAGDHPRVTVGRDGFVYVSYWSGSNAMLDKYTACDAAQTMTHVVGFPVTVSAFTDVVCPVPGLDRCDTGPNILASPTAAVDDLDARHVYYAFATSTGAGNEDVMLFDSTDSGATFTRSARLNTATPGRRYLPWLSTYGGVAAVSWYDRRTATAANNDRTRFYFATAAAKGPNLVALGERDLSGVDDTQCSTWPCSTRATTDSESCAAQPQLAGWCVTFIGGGLSGSFTPCDFSSGGCPAGETCFPAGGCPKFGDYNGNAAGAGRHYAAWAAFVPPVGGGASTGSINVYTSADAIPSDFFVRDWTNSATDHDRGEQPSTNPVFWATSDVWNQNTSTPPAIPAATDWVVGDAPTRSGPNFAFARVSRTAAAAAGVPVANVVVNFLQADFGMGSMFTAAGSESVAFNAGDTTRVTPGHAWTVSPTATTHLCLAVQITGPDLDDFAAPSLTTTAPGPGDPLILIDNNKAQRNLQETVGTGGGSGAAGSAEMFAQIRNSSKNARTMRVGIRASGRAVDVDGSATIIGGESIALRGKEPAMLVLEDMKPGEVRWLKCSVHPNSETPLDVNFFDASGHDAAPANGFTIEFTRAGSPVVAYRNLVALADVLLRIAALEQNKTAETLARNARVIAGHRGKMDPGDYLRFWAENRSSVERIVKTQLKTAPRDLFGITEAMSNLNKGVTTKDIDLLTAANNALAERLDAHLSMR